MNNKKSFIKSYRFLQLLTGIIYLIMAILAMRYSKESVIASIQLVGVFSLIKGCFELMNHQKIAQRTKRKQYSALVIGFVDCIIGLILIVNTTLDVSSLSILFGFWFICDSVLSFFMLDLAKLIAMPYYYFSLIVDLIGCLIGLLLLIGGDTLIIAVPTLIGNYFLLFGMAKIIGGIINKDDLHSVK
ncbi:hypothetical protein IGI96_002331 [Enterococcus sp. DIV0421]|uniref:DUF308 domain-containing protein n=1 Tax=Enterococcus TaxID=1350 RepID=UPI000A356E0E|nr:MULTISPECIES: DUF308 domain-containing protein [Enterococcus]OTO01184.1 hypothetical protein A5883_003501 [Enterococcus sp. 5B3_DIV0040]